MSYSSTHSSASEAVRTLHEYYFKSDWQGTDPGDFIWRFRSIPFPQGSEALYYVADGYLGPSITASAIARKLLRIRNHWEPKALTVFARAYVGLEQQRMVDSALNIATRLCDVVWNLRNRETKYPSWGLSFPMRAEGHVFLPANTPTALITALAGLAFLDVYQATGNEEHLNRAKSAGLYVSRELGRTDYPEGICFWYTPVMQKRIHNANALAAMFLNRLGRVTSVHEFELLADSAYSLLISRQSRIGGWNYLVDGKARARLFDNFHTGFIIESLLRYRGRLVDEVRKSVENALTFYRRLFDSSGVPLFNLARSYPKDIHDVAQGVLVFSLAQLELGVGLAEAQRIWQFAHRCLRRRDGTFISRVYRYGRSKANYPRWADSWMLLGLSELLKALSSTSPQRCVSA